MDKLINSDFEKAHEVLDAFQLIMQEEPQVECPLVHTFTKGLYSRQINMPKDSYIISKVHKTQHQFVVSQGVVDVYNVVDGTCERLIAPYSGVTEPGTRRLLYTCEDTIWTTYHPTDKTTVEEVEEDIIEKREVTGKALVMDQLKWIGEILNKNVESEDIE